MLYEMIVNGERKFLPFEEAYRVYDCGFAQVSFGELVIEGDRSRPFTDSEKRKISSAADDYSMNK